VAVADPSGLYANGCYTCNDAGVRTPMNMGPDLGGVGGEGGQLWDLNENDWDQGVWSFTFAQNELSDFMGQGPGVAGSGTPLFFLFMWFADPREGPWVDS